MTANKVFDEHAYDFLLLSSSAKLPAKSRTLKVGTGLSYSDSGPKGEFCVEVDPFFLSGSTSDSQAEYIVNTFTSSLPNARKLVTGSGVIITEDAIEKTLTVEVDQDFVRSLFVFQEKPSPEPDGITTTFSLGSVPYPSESLMFYVNGVLQSQGPTCDYTISGSTVEMSYTPRPGSNIFCSYPRSV